MCHKVKCQSQWDKKKIMTSNVFDPQDYTFSHSFFKKVQPVKAEEAMPKIAPTSIFLKSQVLPLITLQKFNCCFHVVGLRA